MEEFSFMVDEKKIPVEQLKLLFAELATVATVKDNKVFYDKTNQEQSKRISEIFDKYLLSK